MAKIEAFEEYAEEYDEWFVKNNQVFLSELDAVSGLLPSSKNGLEIGVGSGRFAFLLEIKTGVEPCPRLAQLAKKRSITVYENVAEDLPFENGTFDFVLMVTVICFLDDISRALKEAHRVLKDSGHIIVAFIDKNSTIGKKYYKNKDRSRFFKDATFYSVDEVVDFLRNGGFGKFEFRQTLFSEDNTAFHPVKDGYGSGSFIVVKAVRQ